MTDYIKSFAIVNSKTTNIAISL